MNTPPVQETELIESPVALPPHGPSASWYTVRDIARALGCDKKTVRRTARRENWPARPNGNREDYSPPDAVARLIIATPQGRGASRPTPIVVRFSDLIPGTDQHTKVLRREEAVKSFLSLLHFGKEIALETAAASLRAKYLDFACSARALRRWVERYQLDGLDGLVEQKLGIVGIKPFVNDLSQEQLLSAAAAAVGHGQWKRNKTAGRLNLAAAMRDTVANPTIKGDARRWLHGARHSKSAYPPSFKKAIRQLVSPLAATMLQVGKKAARLDGPFTNADYSDGCANHAVTADDMTANHYVWLEWANERGFVLVRPQILAVLHVGSLCWLNVRVVVSARRLKEGQTTASSTYDKDDVWGLFGDTFDQFGIFADEFDQPKMVFILEGGIWQAQVITGRQVMPDDDVRLGGLRSLGRGIQIIHTRTPLGKAAIEGGFHVFQATGDDVPGYTGRDSRHDMPEQTKANIARVKAGEHPRGMFLHLHEYQAHVQTVMHNLNTTRNDGKICEGMTPVEKFRSLNLRTVMFPERLKHLYRADYAVEKVTRNGFKITRRIAGVNAVFEYDHKALENYRGMPVCGYWNPGHPDTAAVIFSIKNGRPYKQICVASRVTNPSRLGAPAEDLSAEATRKSLKVSFAASQAKTLAPFLLCNVKLAELAPRAAAVGDAIAGAQADNTRRVTTTNNAAKFRAIKKQLAAGPDLRGSRGDEALTDSVPPSESLEESGVSQVALPQPGENPAKNPSADREAAQSANHICGVTPNDDGSIDYVLNASGAATTGAGASRRYVDYLVDRLTEFRKAGASFGQHTGPISAAVTKKIAKSHLGCDLHDQSRFDDVCNYLQSKIDATILGKRNTAKGTPSYHPFEEHAPQ